VGCSSLGWLPLLERWPCAPCVVSFAPFVVFECTIVQGCAWYWYCVVCVDVFGGVLVMSWFSFGWRCHLSARRNRVLLGFSSPRKAIRLVRFAGCSYSPY